jgi:hypothetical protein
VRPRHALLEHREEHRPRPEVDVGCREDLRAGQVADAVDVDARDARVRERRADERRVDRALERQVLDVATGARQEAGIFTAQDSLADEVQSVLLARCGLIDAFSARGRFPPVTGSAIGSRQRGGRWGPELTGVNL